MFYRIREWFLDLFSQKIEGYICPREDGRIDSVNEKIIEKYQIKVLKFRINFLDSENHWVECYFIPKNVQKDLKFLTKLKNIIPMTGIFKKRKLKGFQKNQYDIIELWSQTTFKEIRSQYFNESIELDAESSRLAQLDAEKAAIKHQQKLEKKLAAKEEKRLEREKIKLEKEEAKRLEKEKNKESKSKK